MGIEFLLLTNEVGDLQVWRSARNSAERDPPNGRGFRRLYESGRTNDTLKEAKNNLSLSRWIYLQIARTIPADDEVLGNTNRAQPWWLNPAKNRIRKITQLEGLSQQDSPCACLFD